jgi:hypothetical protein
MAASHVVVLAGAWCPLLSEVAKPKKVDLLHVDVTPSTSVSFGLAEKAKAPNGC